MLQLNRTWQLMRQNVQWLYLFDSHLFGKCWGGYCPKRDSVFFFFRVSLFFISPGKVLVEHQPLANMFFLARKFSISMVNIYILRQLSWHILCDIYLNDLFCFWVFFTLGIIQARESMIFKAECWSCINILTIPQTKNSFSILQCSLICVR